VGKRIHDLIHARHSDGSDYPFEDCPVVHTLRTGQSVRAENEVLWTRNGRSFPVEYGVFPLVDGDETRGVVVNFLDISARKEAERERSLLLERERVARGRAERAEMQSRFLAEASEKLAASLDYESTLRTLARLTVPAIADSYIIYLLDEAGQVQRAEPTHKDPAMQILLQEKLDRHPPRLETLIPPVRDALTLGRTTRLENVTAETLRALPEDLEHDSIVDQLQLRSLIVVPLRTRNRILGAISYGSTSADQFNGPERQQLIEELAMRAALAIESAQLYNAAQQAIQAREEVIGIVSHDLRTPLNVVQMGAKALLRHCFRDKGDEIVRRQLEVIGLSAERMSGLVRDLLDLVQIDSGRLPIHPEPTDAAELVEESIEGIRPLAEEKLISLRVDLPARLPALLVDPGRVHQVFTNLLTNALKFTPQGGTITVAASLTNDDGVRFTVTDSGCGIAAKDLPVLFDRFWQANQRSNRGGIGLGLSIAKGIVEGHQGTIGVESKEGQGTTFFFTLPACRISIVPGSRVPGEGQESWNSRRSLRSGSDG
jgi:signal transduction histidine kinase